jgi:hypothetical protein
LYCITEHSHTFFYSTDKQLQSVAELKGWLGRVSQVDRPTFMGVRQHFQQFTPGDVFIGYNDDAPASIVLRLGKQVGADAETIVDRAKSIFLECATPGNLIVS